MKHVKRTAVVVALALGLLGLAFLPAPEAGAMKPRCGEQRDGTFNSSDYSCSGAAANCTETTVCG